MIITKDIKYFELGSSNKDIINQAICMLKEAFAFSDDEIKDVFDVSNVCVMAVSDNVLLGLIGAQPQYNYTGWELHPLVVHKQYRYQGIGKGLVNYLENLLKSKGCITIYLGTDDELNSTTLSNTDLYMDTYEKIRNIVNLKKHPYTFYQKQGYKIVGVLPDVNGIGKPDILMAKRL